MNLSDSVWKIFAQCTRKLSLTHTEGGALVKLSQGLHFKKKFFLYLSHLCIADKHYIHNQAIQDYDHINKPNLRAYEQNWLIYTFLVLSKPLILGVLAVLQFFVKVSLR